MKHAGPWTSAYSSTVSRWRRSTLKNSLTKQTVDDAIEQYRRDRDPRETIFTFGRCIVHFAMETSRFRCVPS